MVCYQFYGESQELSQHLSNMTNVEDEKISILYESRCGLSE